MKIFSQNMKGISLQDLHSVDWGANRDDLPLDEAYQVPIVYRAVHIRANALGSLPFALFRGGRELDIEAEEYTKYLGIMRPLLYGIESCLCIYGAAYVLIEKNTYGRNPTPRLLSPPTITPKYDHQTGEILHFQRTTGAGGFTIPIEDMLWFWLPSFSFENAPGISPLMSALGSAGTLQNLVDFARSYFKNGALQPTLFFLDDSAGGLPSTVTPRELETFLSRLRRILTGKNNAWKIEAMRGKVQSERIGALPSEIAAPDITALSRQDVSMAFGIPESLFTSSASTYASASMDVHNVYDLVIIPEAEIVVAPVLNRWLEMQGMHMVFQPQQLESYQQYQREQAQSVAPLVGAPILTVNEARAMFGYPPIAGGDDISSGGDIPAGDIPSIRSIQDNLLQSLWREYP